MKDTASLGISKFKLEVLIFVRYLDRMIDLFLLKIT